MGTIACDKHYRRPYSWCITNQGRCQFKESEKDQIPIQDGMWCTTAPERLAIESYIILKEEEVLSCQKK